MQPNRRKFACRTIGCLFVLCNDEKKSSGWKDEGQLMSLNPRSANRIVPTVTFDNSTSQLKSLCRGQIDFIQEKCNRHFSTLEEERSFKTQREGLRAEETSLTDFAESKEKCRFALDFHWLSQSDQLFSQRERFLCGFNDRFHCFFVSFRWNEFLQIDL